jgi:phage shock protein PspC (stress-responsive transcriptional regulator)
MDPTKTCAACAMEINVRASKCPHCRTPQSNASRMHRDVPDRKIAGVCAAVAQQLGLDPVLVRVAFVVAALMSGGLTAGVYLLLWLATPNTPGERAPLTRILDWVDSLTSPSRGTGRPTPEPPSAPQV